MNTHFNRTRKRRGAAMVEFGLWLPIMVFILSGLMDFSWYIAQSQNVMQAARDGARAAAADTADDPKSAGEIAAARMVGTMGVSCVAADAVVVEPRTDEDNGYNVVDVTVTCPFNPLLGLVPQLPDVIEYRFTMLLDDQELEFEG